jgi:hypothetical protein
MIDPNLAYIDNRRRYGAPALPEGEFRPGWRPAPLRQIIEDEIERLIASLDRVDGDCDLEDGHDKEPEYY